MKKLLYIALLLTAFISLHSKGLAQGAPPFRLQEIDGSPSVLSPTVIKVTNGTLSCSGKTCTITISGGGGGGITIGTTTITSGTNTRVLYNNAGVVGEYAVTGTGNAVLSASPTLTGTVGMAAMTATGTIVQTSASATAFESGPNGSTNPVFRLVNNVASAATGLSITGNAAGSGVTLTALSSGSNEDLILVGKGNGAITATYSGASVSTPMFQVKDNSTVAFSVARNNYLVTIGSAATILLDPTAQYLQFSGAGDIRRGAFATFTITNPNLRWPSSTPDVNIDRLAAGALRIGNGSTGAGNLLIGTSAGAIGTSGAGVLAFTLSTAPTTSPTDTVQLYSGDAAAGAHDLYSRNEAGEINRLTGLAARNSSSFAKTSDTTLANITGLSRNVEASRTYAFTAVMQTTAAATGGVKFSVSGTATATAISYEGILMDGAAVVAQTRATALDTAVCASTTSTAGTCTIRGVIQVNAAGTLTVQFAQNASDGSASTVLANQYLQLIPIS